MKKQSSDLSLKDVLSAFALEPTHDRSTFDRYLREFPQYSIEVANLSSELSRPPLEERDLTSRDRETIEEAWRRYANSPSAEASNVLEILSVPQLRALADTLGVPRQVISAFREQRVIAASIPRSFLSRLAVALNATIEKVTASLTNPLGVRHARSNKSEEKPVVAPPATFEQLLIEAQVPAEKRAELMAEGD